MTCTPELLEMLTIYHTLSICPLCREVIKYVINIFHNSSGQLWALVFWTDIYFDLRVTIFYIL